MGSLPWCSQHCPGLQGSWGTGMSQERAGMRRDEAGSSAPQCPCRKGFSAAEPSLGFSLLPSRGMHGSVQGRLAPASGWHCPQGVTAQGGPGLRVAQDRGKAPGRFQGSWAVEPSALPGGRADSAAVNNLERARGSRGAARDVSVGLCGWGAPGEHPRGASQPRHSWPLLRALLRVYYSSSCPSSRVWSSSGPARFLTI